MIFTVTFRDSKTREKKALEFDVPNREALWPILKEQGITAISVTDGKVAHGIRRKRTTSAKQQSSFTASAVLRILISVVLGAICCAAIVYFSMRKKDTTEVPVPKETKPLPKETVKPPPSTTNDSPAKVEPPLKPGERRDVKWTRPANWDQMTLAQRTRAQPVGRVIRPKWMDEKKLFTKITDQKIHRLLRVRPGQLFLGTATYDDRFVKSFLESLNEPIEFTEDDTPEDREMKQAVIDTRKELKEAYDKGEDIAEIMRETERQMHEQAAYRLNLRNTIIEYKKSGEHSDQDIKDYITAANTILKEHGMEPLKLDKFWFHKALIDSKGEE